MGFLFYFLINFLLILRLILKNLGFKKLKIIFFVFLINFIINDFLVILGTNSITSIWIIFLDLKDISHKMIAILVVILFVILLNNIKVLLWFAATFRQCLWCLQLSCRPRMLDLSQNQYILKCIANWVNKINENTLNGWKSNGLVTVDFEGIFEKYFVNITALQASSNWRFTWKYFERFQLY